MKYCKLTNTDTTTDLNVTDKVVPWGELKHIDSPPFEFDDANDSIIVQEDGLYEIRSIIFSYTSSSRTNPVARIKLNGTTYLEGWGGSGYTRNNDGHREASNSPHTVQELTAGDYLQIETFQEASGGTRDMIRSDSSNFFVKQIPSVKYFGGTRFKGEESGNIATSSTRTVAISNIKADQTLSIQNATFTTGISGPVPTSFDMKIVTMDNTGVKTDRATVLSGDGNSVYDNMPGGPLASWTNTTGSDTTIAVIVDNQSGSSQSFMSSVEGVIRY